MVRFLRWTFGVVSAGGVGLLLGALFEQKIIAFLTTLGYYEYGFSWVSEIVSAAAFPWVSGIIFGITIGLYLDQMARRIDKNRDQQLTELGNKLAKSGTIFSGLYRRIWENGNRNFPDFPELEQYVHEIESLLISLSKKGIQTPDISFEADPIGFVDRMRLFASKIAPLLKDGHLRYAISASKILKMEIETASPKLIDHSKPTIEVDQRLLPPNTGSRIQL